MYVCMYVRMYVCILMCVLKNQLHVRTYMRTYVFMYVRMYVCMYVCILTCMLQDLELSTAAVAHVYLEKLILDNLTRKDSRKISAAVCLLLAIKFNEAPRDTRVSAMKEVVEKQNRCFCLYVCMYVCM
jgi:hypothetical protein